MTKLGCQAVRWSKGHLVVTPPPWDPPPIFHRPAIHPMPWAAETQDPRPKSNRLMLGLWGKKQALQNIPGPCLIARVASSIILGNDWQDGAGNQIPILADGNRNHGLYVQRDTIPIGNPNILIGIELKGDSDQIGNRGLQLPSHGFFFALLLGQSGGLPHKKQNPSNHRQPETKHTLCHKCKPLF